MNTCTPDRHVFLTMTVKGVTWSMTTCQCGQLLRQGDAVVAERVPGHAK